MIAYVESSVVLRLVLGQRGALAEWPLLDAGVSSALAEVECLRTLDRLRLVQGLPDAELVRRRAAVYDLLDTLEVVEPTRPILSRAGQPFPINLGTLDAIHLATAMLWREASQKDLIVATHDARLGLAARAVGFDIMGA